ncbi:hypothetical protein RRG08_050287 [Elysia crispata]|uniref:Uncharacterized protein n=1 Tax=Elysia crispata TaxID=231223 RepID=A0AAE1AEJ3_9GAST|nr:hypothetical protein RRG08_050287 [Elysia crispata]
MATVKLKGIGKFVTFLYVVIMDSYTSPMNTVLWHWRLFANEVLRHGLNTCCFVFFLPGLREPIQLYSGIEVSETMLDEITEGMLGETKILQSHDRRCEIETCREMIGE